MNTHLQFHLPDRNPQATELNTPIVSFRSSCPDIVLLLRKRVVTIMVSFRKLNSFIRKVTIKKCQKYALGLKSLLEYETGLSFMSMFKRVALGSSFLFFNVTCCNTLKIFH